MPDALTLDPAWLGEAPIVQAPNEPDADGPGNWPRMLVLEEEVENRLKMWIDSELEGFFQERQPLLEDWKRWQALYWAEPEKKVRNFPFKKAANIVVPLAAIAVEAIHARLMNTLFSVEPFWSIRPRSKEWVSAAKPFEKYLQSEVESGETLDMYGFCNEALLELTKLGTCVGKSGYEKDIRKSFRQVGDDEEPVYFVAKNGAILERVPLANYIQRFAELDPQTSPLVGEEHEVGWGQMKRFAQNGRMIPEAVDAVKTFWTHAHQADDTGSGAELQQEVDKLAKTEPQWTEKFRFVELWLTFDVNEDGEDEEIVVDYHRGAREILSVRYNWNDDLHRPYRVSSFQNVEGIWPGIGVCKMVEQQQAEATTIHRQRLDNATLANISNIALQKDSGYGMDEPVFPGKIWFLDDPQRDISEFKLSDVYPSSYANEESVVRYFEKRSGVNEVILGIPQQGTPGTATSDLTRLAEGNKRFDLVLKNVRRWLSSIGYDVIMNYQQFGNQQVHWLVLGDDGEWVDHVLNMPSVLVKRGAMIDLTVTDSITNREVEQQQWLGLFQVITNYYDRVLQLAQILAEGTGNAEMFIGIAQRALMSSDEAMRRLLETFNIPDADRFSLVEETPENVGQGNQGQGGVEGNGAGGGGITPTDSIPTAAILEALGAQNGPGGGVNPGTAQRVADPGRF